MKFSGRTTSHSHKFDDWYSKKSDGAKCVSSVKFMNIQWSDCPVEIEDIVRKLWVSHELSNDTCILKFESFENLEIDIFGENNKSDFEVFKNYCLSQGINDNELVVIHWWW